MSEITKQDLAMCPRYNKDFPKEVCKVAKKAICGKDLFCCDDCEEWENCRMGCKMVEYWREKK